MLRERNERRLIELGIAIVTSLTKGLAQNAILGSMQAKFDI